MQMTSIEYLVEGWLEKKSNYLLLSLSYPPPLNWCIITDF